MEKKDIRRIRKLAFSKNHDFDEELAHILNDNKEYLFSKNPVVQNIYKYQIDYLCSFSKEWFKSETIKILDWGCGKGHVSYWLKKMKENVTSCDVSNSGVTSAFVIGSPLYAKKNIGLVRQPGWLPHKSRIFGAKAPKNAVFLEEVVLKLKFPNNSIDVIELRHEYILPFNDSSFDVILSFGVLEHTPNDMESLKEITRILRPNGLFFCFHLPYKLSYTQNIAHLRGNWYHSKLYGKKAVKNLLESVNLEILDIWHRALFPKRSFVPPFYNAIERIDNWLCNYSLLKYFATNIEFVAKNGYENLWHGT